VKPNEKTPEMEQEPITYNVGKITFIVTPVYREDSNKTIHDILLGWMIKDSENPCNH
jgi:hypothetical protein